MWKPLERALNFFITPAPNITVLGVEERDAANCTPTDIWGHPDFGNSISAANVNSNSALSVPSVWAAVRVISETLASLPFDLFIKTDSGSEPATNHPVRYLVRTEPSPYVSAYEFRRSMFAKACMGDAFAKIHRNGIGRPVRLEIMNGPVTVDQNERGENFYVWNWQRGNKSGVEVLFANEVLHIKNFNLDGVAGLNVSTTHRDSLGFAISANQYGNYFFANSANVDKVLTYPGTLDAKQRGQLESKVNAKSGVKKSGSTMVLDGGMDMKRIGLSPEEAMLNDSRAFQINESSRIFGVPVHLLHNMDRATFNNIYVMNVQFVVLCLTPWAVQFEQELKLKLLTRDEKESDNLYFRHNFEGLLRGNPIERAQYIQALWNSGALTVDEVREMDGRNKVPGGDRRYIPVNMALVDDEGKLEAIEPAEPVEMPTVAGANEDTDEQGSESN